MKIGRNIYLGIACPFCGSLNTIGRGVVYLCSRCNHEWDMSAEAQRTLTDKQRSDQKGDERVA